MDKSVVCQAAGAAHLYEAKVTSLCQQTSIEVLELVAIFTGRAARSVNEVLTEARPIIAVGWFAPTLSAQLTRR